MIDYSANPELVAKYGPPKLLPKTVETPWGDHLPVGDIFPHPTYGYGVVARNGVQFSHNRPMTECLFTMSNHLVWPLNPHRDDFDIYDIAIGMSRECRFGNQLPGHYPVAWHCYVLSKVVPPELARQALMHDAAEGYLHDMPRPIKGLIGDYKKIEDDLLDAIFSWLGIEPIPEGIGGLHDWDGWIAKVEGLKFYGNLAKRKFHLLGYTGEQLMQFAEDCPEDVRYVSVEEAYCAWLHRFKELFPEHVALLD